MPNRLADETSPYLRQHATNPVDWYPWGPEALERSRREDRPILLSIGYAACHWCHVMAHESFENETTARLMNELFVNVKVDREERPDLDAIYMQATQAMTGHGGWPMTVFLTPETIPFYAGTYFPPDDRPGMPSFSRMLRTIADAYRNKKADVARTAAEIAKLYAASVQPARGTGPLTPALLDRAYRGIVQRADQRHGGFDGAPKFPQAMALDFLLRHARRTGETHGLDIALLSYRRMARGGIYDQIGGGFARYAVDDAWRVPHFEKMLYDNALLTRLGTHLWQATGDAELRRVVAETIEWLAREMVDAGGGFYSSLDADSEGHEGRFYVWKLDELSRVLGEDARIAIAYYGVTAEGNFEGASILHVADSPQATATRLGIGVEELERALVRIRRALFEARAPRVRPGRDEKVLAAWNGLMLRALAESARAFGRDDWRTLAIRNGEFLASEMVRDGGRVMRTHSAGVTRIPGFLEDHAAVALGFLSLYELTFDRRWLDRSIAIAEATTKWFWDEETMQFFDTARDAEALVTRPREVTDNALPSGTSLAVELLLRLAELLHDETRRTRATDVMSTVAEPAARYGIAFGHMLGAMELAVYGAVEVALVGEPEADDFGALVAELATRYLPALVLAGGRPVENDDIALLAQRPMREGRATAYVCRDHVCEAPVTDAAAFAEQLERVASGRAVILRERA